MNFVRCLSKLVELSLNSAVGTYQLVGHTWCLLLKAACYLNWALRTEPFDLPVICCNILRTLSRKVVTLVVASRNRNDDKFSFFTGKAKCLMKPMEMCTDYSLINDALRFPASVTELPRAVRQLADCCVLFIYPGVVGFLRDA